MVYAADLGSVATSVEVRILSKAVHFIVQKSTLPPVKVLVGGRGFQAGGFALRRPAAELVAKPAFALPLRTASPPAPSY